MTKTARIADIINEANTRMRMRESEWFTGGREISDKAQRETDKRQNTQERIIRGMDRDGLSSSAPVTMPTHIAFHTCPHCHATYLR